MAKYYSGTIEMKANRSNAISNVYTLLGILIENGYSVTASKNDDSFKIYYFKAVKKNESRD